MLDTHRARAFGYYGKGKPSDAKKQLFHGELYVISIRNKDHVLFL